jgi:transcriptional regulator with PAS, ATPase and Fis domain
MQKRFIYESLKRNNWNRRATAAEMGIHPTTLWRKIKHLKLDIPKQDGRYKA